MVSRAMTLIAMMTPYREKKLIDVAQYFISIKPIYEPPKTYIHTLYKNIIEKFNKF